MICNGERSDYMTAEEMRKDQKEIYELAEMLYEAKKRNPNISHDLNIFFKGLTLGVNINNGFQSPAV
nr:MAG TPA: anastral spindle 2 [Caudoviricetes sp.]